MIWFGIALVFLVLLAVFRSIFWAAVATGLLYWLHSKYGTPSMPEWVGYSYSVVTGWMSDHVKLLIWWYGVGLISALFWPLKYKHAIHRREWPWLLVGTPFYALLGPIALLARMPI